MEDYTAVIKLGNEPKAQMQIIEGSSGKRVQLYNLNGVMLCEMSFDGDNDFGFALGNAMFIGYSKGWENCDYVMYRAVTDAIQKASGGLKL